MQDVVVDASVVVMLLIAEVLSPNAQALLTDSQHAGDRVVAPHVLLFEITNAIRRHMRREGVSMADALVILDDFLALPIDLEVDSELHRQALRLTEAHSLGG